MGDNSPPATLPHCWEFPTAPLIRVRAAISLSRVRRSVAFFRTWPSGVGCARQPGCTLVWLLQLSRGPSFLRRCGLCHHLFASRRAHLTSGFRCGLRLVIALLTAAIIWNLGTWWFGLPVSSSHTLIGSIDGVGVANALMRGLDGTSAPRATRSTD